MPESILNQIIANNINDLMHRLGKTQVELADYMDVSQATVSNWCKGIKMPRMDKIDKICAFLNCKRSDLMEDHSDPADESSRYYFDDETAAMAQTLFEDENYRILFDAAKDCAPEDLQMAAAMLKRMKATNPEG